MTEQFRKIRGDTAMKDYELAKMSLAELLQPTVERMADEEPEKLGKMFKPAQLAKMFKPAQLAKVLTEALTPEQLTEMLEALPPEVREQIKQRLH
jgi:hypothetical protein